jgi:hypothetical protein
LIASHISKHDILAPPVFPSVFVPLHISHWAVLPGNFPERELSFDTCSLSEGAFEFCCCAPELPIEGSLRLELLSSAQYPGPNEGWRTEAEF